MVERSDFLICLLKIRKLFIRWKMYEGAMSTLLFATTSSSYCKGYVSSPVMFNGEYVQYPFTRRNNVSSILYTNDLILENFFV